MLGFFIFAFGFAIFLTLVVRAARFRVRQPVREETALALTAGFVALLPLVWWMLTHGKTIEDRVLAPLILPSPAEVLQAFPALHFEQGLVRSALTSFVRVTLGFSLA